MFRFTGACLLLLLYTACGWALHYEVYDLSFWVRVHVLEVDPDEVEVIAVRAKGAYSRQPVSHLAKRHGALAGINGGFWTADGRPAGVLRIAGEDMGKPRKKRGAVAWRDGGREVWIDRIGPDELLEWTKAEFIVGGVPLLIHRGEGLELFSPEEALPSFIHGAHSRTAVGLLPDGKWVFVVAQGPFCGWMGGMTIPELRDFLLGLGCVEAVNLDGGGSATMFYDGQVQNRHCRGIFGERAVSDAILVVPRER